MFLKSLLGIVVLFALIFGAFLFMRDSAENKINVSSFDECVEAGYMILDSYPEQCETPDGQRFVREIGDENPIVETRTVQLYYYNSQNDLDADGNIMCSEAGLVPVNRIIPITQTPIQDVINLLLLGELTDEEKVRGITTEYPLGNFELEGASLSDGVLTLGFADPDNKTSGGSCRSGILWLQIRETAKQFEIIEEVRFLPEELFQP